MTAPRRLRPVLKCAKKNVPLLLVLAQLVHDKMLDNIGIFPAPFVPLGTLAQQIADLAASQRALKRRLLTAAERDVKRDVLWTTLEDLLQYVQGISDGAGEQSAAIIESAGFKVATAPVAPKPPLGAKRGQAPGSVILRANATLLAASPSRRGRFFGWEYTLDGRTFVAVDPTTVAHTTIAGLPALTVAGFRARVVDSTGPGAWSQVVSLVVH
jgi:hypothetical protein